MKKIKDGRLKIIIRKYVMQAMTSSKNLYNEIKYVVEVSLSVLSPEIEDRNAVEVDNWAKQKETFHSQ
jgi:hypothetical protein